MLCHLLSFAPCLLLCATCSWGNLARDAGTNGGPENVGERALWFMPAVSLAFPEHCSEGGGRNSEMDTLWSLPQR